MCEYMGLEPTAANKETLKSLGNGECMFQDLDGHVGILKFDAVFQDLIDVFSTTPKAGKKSDTTASIKTEPEPEPEAEKEEKEAAVELPKPETVTARREEPKAEEFNFDFSDEELFRKEV